MCMIRIIAKYHFWILEHLIEIGVFIYKFIIIINLFLKSLCKLNLVIKYILTY